MNRPPSNDAIFRKLHHTTRQSKIIMSPFHSLLLPSYSFTMGNIVVTPLDPYDTRPASMAQCVDPTGKLDVLQVSRYWQRQDEESSSLVENLFSRSSSNDECPPKKRVRSVKSNGLEMLDSQGNRVPADPRQSPWYKQYVQDPHIEKPKFQNNVCGIAECAPRYQGRCTQSLQSHTRP
jgi:hypothetical protein